MKSRIFAVLVVAAVFMLFTGCGDKPADTTHPAPSEEVDKEIPEPAAEEPAAEESSTGEFFENRMLSVTLAEGWEVYDDALDKGLMRIRRQDDQTGMGPTIYFTFHGKIAGKYPCASDPEQDVAAFSRQYEGSEVEKVVYNKIPYYKTVIDYGGPQAMLQTKIGGSCIHVKLAGRDALTNPDIQSMLNTVSYKTETTEMAD